MVYLLELQPFQVEVTSYLNKDGSALETNISAGSSFDTSGARDREGSDGDP